jgi:tetratricopeptide (TPR) repeat protein
MPFNILKKFFGKSKNIGEIENERRFNEAKELIKQAIRTNPKLANEYSELGKTHYLMGIVYDKLGRFNEAIEAYKQAIRINPELADSHLKLGIVYCALGNKGSALDEYNILKDLDKDLANTLFNLINKLSKFIGLKLCPNCNAYQDGRHLKCPNCSYDISNIEIK